MPMKTALPGRGMLPNDLGLAADPKHSVLELLRNRDFVAAFFFSAIGIVTSLYVRHLYPPADQAIELLAQFP
jgi:hypothetical protein